MPLMSGFSLIVHIHLSVVAPTTLQTIWQVGRGSRLAVVHEQTTINAAIAKEMVASVAVARGLSDEFIPAAAEQLYVLMFQIPAASRLTSVVRNVESGESLANLLFASGNGLQQDAALVPSFRHMIS